MQNQAVKKIKLKIKTRFTAQEIQNFIAFLDKLILVSLCVYVSYFPISGLFLVSNNLSYLQVILSYAFIIIVFPAFLLKTILCRKANIVTTIVSYLAIIFMIFQVLVFIISPDQFRGNSDNWLIMSDNLLQNLVFITIFLIIVNSKFTSANLQTIVKAIFLGDLILVLWIFVNSLLRLIDHNFLSISLSLEEIVYSSILIIGISVLALSQIITITKTDKVTKILAAATLNLNLLLLFLTTNTLAVLICLSFLFITLTINLFVYKKESIVSSNSILYRISIAAIIIEVLLLVTIIFSGITDFGLLLSEKNILIRQISTIQDSFSQIIDKQGILGAISLLVLGCLLITGLVRSLKKDNFSISFPIMLITFLLLGLFFNDLSQQMPLFWVIFGLSVNQSNSNNYEIKTTDYPILKFALASVLPLAILIFVTYSTLHLAESIKVELRNEFKTTEFQG